jgi:hypothetical protein
VVSRFRRPRSPEQRILEATKPRRLMVTGLLCVLHALLVAHGPAQACRALGAPRFALRIAYLDQCRQMKGDFVARYETTDESCIGSSQFTFVDPLITVFPTLYSCLAVKL